MASSYPNAELLAELEWLAKNLKEKDLKVVDLRTPMEYAMGHIEGAINIDFSSIAPPRGGLPNMCPSKEEFEALLGSKGISNDTIIVAYDNSWGLLASRFIWTLERYGHSGKLLNGTLKEWVRRGYPWSRDSVEVRPTNFKAEPKDDALCTADWLLRNLGRPDLALLDVRNPQELDNPGTPGLRPGRIPGAVMITWNQALDPKTGSYRPYEELLQLYEGRGITKEKEVVAYCSTGVRSAHTYVTLRLLGYSRIRNYDGSWSEWGARPDLPIEK